MEKKAGLALAALILMLACPALSPGQEEKLDKIRVARASDSATESALWFTKEGGFFEKHGISAELIRLQGSSLVVSTMLAGEIALSQIGAAAVVDSGLAGGDLTNVATIVRNFVFYIFSRLDGFTLNLIQILLWNILIIIRKMHLPLFICPFINF